MYFMRHKNDMQDTNERYICIIVIAGTDRTEDSTLYAAKNFGKATDINVAASLYNRWIAIRSNRSCAEAGTI